MSFDIYYILLLQLVLTCSVAIFFVGSMMPLSQLNRIRIFRNGALIAKSDDGVEILQIGKRKIDLELYFKYRKKYFLMRMSYLPTADKVERLFKKLQRCKKQTHSGLKLKLVNIDEEILNNFKRELASKVKECDDSSYAQLLRGKRSILLRVEFLLGGVLVFTALTIYFMTFRTEWLWLAILSAIFALCFAENLFYLRAKKIVRVTVCCLQVTLLALVGICAVWTIFSLSLIERPQQPIVTVYFDDYFEDCSDDIFPTEPRNPLIKIDDNFDSDSDLVRLNLSDRDYTALRYFIAAAKGDRDTARALYAVPKGSQVRFNYAFARADLSLSREFEPLAITGVWTLDNPLLMPHASLEDDFPDYLIVYVDIDYWRSCDPLLNRIAGLTMGQSQAGEWYVLSSQHYWAERDLARDRTLESIYEDFLVWLNW